MFRFFALAGAAFAAYYVYRNMKKYKNPVRYPLVTSKYGADRGGVKHHGTDFVSQVGDLNIYAASSGEVTIAAWGYNGGAGNYVEIWDGEHFVRYLHLNNIFVKVGQKVKQGDIIGIMGNTGYSFGTHLHLDVRKERPLTNFIDFEKFA